MHLPFMRWRHATLALLFSVPLYGAAAPDGAPAAAAVPAPASAPPTLASFFDNASFVDAKLSPNGRFLAARVGAPGRRLLLGVVDLQANTLKAVAAFGDADIGNFVWVNDQRLAFDVSEREVALGDTFKGAGLYAVNRDGSDLRQLADRRGEEFLKEADHLAARKLLPWNTFLLGQDGAQDGDSIYVVSPDFESQKEGHSASLRLLSLNTVTGRSISVRGPGHVDRWLLDAQGKPRLAVGSQDANTNVYYLDPATDQWRTLASYNSVSGGKNAIDPQGFGPDGTLYVSAQGGHDTESLYAFDFKTGRIAAESLLETSGYDFAGELLGSRNRLLGVRYETDATGTAWFDPAMRDVQAAVDKLLPTTVNVISVPGAADAPWVLVRAYSDVQAPVFLLYERSTGKLDKVGESHPGLDVRRMARQKVLRYKARDGLEIPALLTLPRDVPKGAKLPLVVLVHGGPYVRGTHWGWHPETQFLASRGYAVLEPEFRGSNGYGARHFRAGWKQWGLKMQDDIADGTRWAIAQGIADPKRICIAGGSYGGYATLMGLVNDPDLYRCGVDWVGVTDIPLMYENFTSFRSDMVAEWYKYGMPEMVGDPVKDAAQLAATSPLRQAARITQPLLLAYGGADYRVPVNHGLKFRDAVAGTNKQVEWIEYREEGHGWALPKNRIDFWGRVEKFLDRQIGKGAAAQ